MTFSGLPSLRDPKQQQQQLQQQRSQQFQHNVKPSTSASTTVPTTSSSAPVYSTPAAVNANVTAIPSTTIATICTTEGSSSPAPVPAGSEPTSMLNQASQSHESFGLTPLALVDPCSALVSTSSQPLQSTSVQLQSEAQAHAQAHAQAQALAQLEATMALTDPSVPTFQPQQQHQSVSQTNIEFQQTDQQPTSTDSNALTSSTVSTSTAPAKPAKKTSKKPTVPPVHNSAYRKRLNVNQVCDWCRYRKIRCDRESPCNSCIHSRRECIRSPPQLVATNTPAEKPVTKRGRPAEDKDGRGSSKAYRNSDMSSVRSSDYTSSSFSSGTESEDDPLASLLGGSSPLVNGINLNTLAMKLTLDGPATPSSETSMLDLMNGPPLVGNGQIPSALASGSNANSDTGRSNAQEEREHIERLQRIELMLCKIVPGASEFIASGNRSQLQQQQQQQHPSGTTIACDQSANQHSQDTTGEPSSQSPNQPSPPSASQCGSTSSPQNTDYIERMKRIELLLSAMSDHPLTRALLSQVRSAKDDGNKKMGKREQKKALKAAQAASGVPVKRPHVAAGFANQKPPPKLPQAIAEAALKKQQAKKKRASAARAKNASAKEKREAEAATAAARESSDSQISASSTSIPTVGVTTNTFGTSLQLPHVPLQNFSQQPSQAAFHLPSTLAQDSSSSAQVMYLPHQPDQSVFSQTTTFQPLSVSNVSSLSVTVPSSTSYGSMFMPATSSTCSSSPSSPVSSNQELVAATGASDGGADGEQPLSMPPMISTDLQTLGNPESVLSASLPTPTQQGQFRFPQPSSQQSQQPHQQNQGMPVAQSNLQLLHQLQRQQQHIKEVSAYSVPSFDLLDHTMQMGATTPTSDTFSGFSQAHHNPMNESLEALMMPNSQVPVVTSLGFQSQGHTQLQLPLQQQQQQQPFSATFDQACAMMQHQQQTQPHQHRHRTSISLSQPQLSRAIWLPSSPESISISHDSTTMPWSPVSEKRSLFQDQQQQQQQQLRRQSMMASLQKSHNQPHSLQHHHQHQQSFYIPEMKDDDGFDGGYDDQSQESSPSTDDTGASHSAADSTPVMTVLAD
ncbi:hypothetical protein BGW41_004945 [Actinomortierella wolfii]|nr:hypothetical protein BGW41_004945 [Actinomortierella wolfii]